MNREPYAKLHASQAIEDLLTDSINDNNQQNWLLSYLDVFVLIIMLVITLLAITDITPPSQPKQANKKISQVQIKPLKKETKALPSAAKHTPTKLAAHSNKKPVIKKSKSTAHLSTEKKLLTREKTNLKIKTTKRETATATQKDLIAHANKKPEIKDIPTHDSPKSISPFVFAEKIIEAEQEKPEIKENQETKKNKEPNITESNPETEILPISEPKKSETKWQDQLQKNLKQFDFVNIKINQGYAQIEIQDNVLFDSAKALLTEDGKVLLTKLTVLLKQSTGIIFIEGHTDNQPIATQQFPSNWELGSARATSVLHFLISQDLNAQRLRAVTYADTMPVADNFTEENRRKNRRVNLLVKIPET